MAEPWLGECVQGPVLGGGKALLCVGHAQWMGSWREMGAVREGFLKEESASDLYSALLGHPLKFPKPEGASDASTACPAYAAPPTPGPTTPWLWGPGTS